MGVSTWDRAAVHSPGQADRDAYVESFNGKLRDECLNSHYFASVADAQAVLDVWRDDYNRVRPHSALQDRTPADVGSMWNVSRESGESSAMEEPHKLEIAGCSVAFPA